MLAFPNRPVGSALRDNIGPWGAEGWADYAYATADGRTELVHFAFGCPTLKITGAIDPNYATVNPSSAYGVWARAGSDSQWKQPVPREKHPLTVAYVWAQGRAPG